MKKINAQNVRGTHDILGDEALLFKNVIDEAIKIANLYNFSYSEFPIFEFSEIFKRTSGDTSDVVKKELYTFFDKSGENELALRPEFTASIMRSIYSNGLNHKLPLKIFTYGQVFRYDRPQKCRQRQFNQINYEVIGLNDPYSDAETIALSMRLLKDLKINNIKLHINSLGNKEVRKNYEESLFNHLSRYKDELSEDSKMRLEKNPLRILDSKNKNDQKLLEDLKGIDEFYDDESRIFFDKVLNYLTNFGIAFVIDKKLVRGLDYYSHTVFEIITEELGAQGTIIAGGRYNELSKFFNEKDEIPSFGCAGGVERLMSLSKIQIDKSKKIGLLIIGENNVVHGLYIAEKLRNQNLSCDLIIGKDLKKNMIKANKGEYNFVIIIGDNEVIKKKYILRNLKNGEQIEFLIEEINEKFFYKN
jgi:histidyl-tRNA synthetase